MPQNKTARQSYSFGYGYTLSGALATETYPSQRHVGYKYDTAGRVSLVSNGPLGITPLSYATNFSYTPQGTISGMTLGNGVTQTTGYNNRLQIQSIGAAKGGANLLGLTYSYPPATNNGSLSSQQIQHDAVGSEAALNVTQNYSSYDAMNRLAAFGEGTVSQTYGYDNYGNLWVNPSSTGYALNSLTPTGSTAFGSDNRLAAQSYDGRGNQTSYTPYTLAYDGDDQQISATSLQNDSASYQYDADGQRVVKTTCSGSTPCTSGSSGLVTTVYVYDAMGQVAAEYSTQPAMGGTRYLTSDHLGSTRMVTDSGGNVVQRHDYLPFGEELFAGMNGRSNLYPAAPQVGMLYTGQLRDEKTELDFFNARYFSGPQARFTGPDGPFNDQDVSDPQSWNLYTYVRNDPLNGTDPSGEVEQLPSFGEVCGNPCNVTAPSAPIPFSWGDPSVAVPQFFDPLPGWQSILNFGFWQWQPSQQSPPPSQPSTQCTSSTMNGQYLGGTCQPLQ